MLFWVKKFAAFWLMPLSASVTAILAGLWLMRSERRARLGRRLALAGVLLLWVSGNHFVARALVRPLETRYAAIPELPAAAAVPPALARCRYVVVLGGGNGTSPGLPALSELSGSALERLTEAIRLLRVLPQAKLIVSGPSDGRREAHATVLSRAAISLGVEPARIILIDSARDTEEEARAVRQQVGETPIALVTSAWHMRRAMALFQKQGVDALPCPTDYMTHADNSFAFHQLLVDAGALGCTSWAIYERVGYWWARLRGKA